MGKERDAFFKAQAEHSTYEPLSRVVIGDRVVGEGQPCFIIGEIGANHGGDLSVARSAITAAKEAGCDAVKFQHITGSKIAADTFIYEEWHGKEIGPLSDFYKSAELSNEWTLELAAHAKEAGILFLSTPFDTEAADVLDAAGVAAFKVASYELTDDVLLAHVAKKGKPVIISTGMGYLEEVAHAIRVIQEAGNNNIIVLHCTSMYPPRSYTDLNLKAITTLREAFKLPVGYSDHSQPPYVGVPVAAVTLGACVIEKHFAMPLSSQTSDSPNSLTPSDLALMVREIRLTEEALSGSGIKQPISYDDHVGDEIFDRFTRRSVYALRTIQAGEVLTPDMVTTLRPWGGIEPRDLHIFIGRALTRTVEARSPLTPEHFFA